MFKWTSMQRWQCQIHTVTLNSLIFSIMNEISRLIILKNDYFQLLFLYTEVFCAFLMQENIKDLAKLDTFNCRKRQFCSTKFIRKRFPGYRCESCISILAWRFTWIYAHSPFRTTLENWFQRNKNKENLVFPIKIHKTVQWSVNPRYMNT